jgi:hypothetical protein
MRMNKVNRNEADGNSVIVDRWISLTKIAGREPSSYSSHPARFHWLCNTSAEADRIAEALEIAGHRFVLVSNRHHVEVIE